MSRDGSMSSTQVNELISKMRNPDMDFRYMALNDLLTELTKSNVPYEQQTNGKLVDAVLRTLEDKNGEVQNLGIKCLGPLVRRSREGYVQAVVDKLCQKGASDELRDIGATALRTVILEVPATTPAATSITSRLVPRLLIQLQEQAGSSEILLDTLDVLVELLNKFGAAISTLQVKDQDMLVRALSSLMDNSRPAIRKRAVVALGNLVMFLPAQSFSAFMSTTIETFSVTRTSEKLKTLVSLVGQICKTETQRSGLGRFGDYLQLIAPIVIDSLEIEDDELRELALQSLESFVSQGGPQIARYESQIMQITLRFLKYDPNYAEEDDENDEMAEVDDGTDLGSDFEDDAEYDDDDDISWKLRRCAAKLAAALIRGQKTGATISNSELLAGIVSKFNDREENVRVEVLQTFVLLLDEINIEQKSQPSPTRKRLREDDEMDIEVPVQVKDTVVGLLPKILRNAIKELDGKSLMAKQVCFSVCSRLIQLDSQTISQNVPKLLQAASSTFTSSTTTVNVSSTSALKISALGLISALVHGIDPTVLEKHVNSFVAVVVEPLLYEKINKISLIALEVAQSLLSNRIVVNNATALKNISDAVFSKISATDLEQEVRDAAIHTVGCCLFSNSTGTNSTVQEKACEILSDRLQHESTRLCTVITIGNVVGRSNGLKNSWLLTVARDTNRYVTNSNRSLRTAAMVTATALVGKVGADLNDNDVQNICQALVPSLESKDSQIILSALSWLRVLAESVKQKSIVSNLTLPCVYELIMTPIVQNSASTSVLLSHYFESVAEPSNIQRIVQRLRSFDTTGVIRHLLCKLIVAVVLQSSDRSVLHQFITEIKAPKTPENDRALSLYVVGEYGRLNELSEIDSMDLILSQFNSPSEQVKSAAAFALGSIASGDVDTHLPLILAQLDESQNDLYLIAVAIKEMIVCTAEDSKEPMLARHAEAICHKILDTKFEEKANSVLAESIGRLTLLRPQLLPELREEILKQSTTSKAVVIRAIRYTFTAASTQFDDQLRPFIVDFLSLMEDETLEIRRLALSTLYSAAHNKPYLIANHLTKLLPLLYQETVIKPDLMHTVQMGPFKHILDDGLELRKNAFETLYTLLDSFHESMDMSTVLDIVLRGLDDVHEIKTLCFLMLAHLASAAPGQTRQKLDAVAEKLAKLVNTKLKDTAVKQDKEKDTELKRATLRCALSLAPLSAESTPGYNAFMDEMRATRGREMEELTASGATAGLVRA